MLQFTLLVFNQPLTAEVIKYSYQEMNIIISATHITNSVSFSFIIQEDKFITAYKKRRNTELYNGDDIIIGFIKLDCKNTKKYCHNIYIYNIKLYEGGLNENLSSAKNVLF